MSVLIIAFTPSAGFWNLKSEICNLTSDIENLKSENWDERDPIYNTDGSFVYACDENGIFNIYHNISDSECINVTNVIGGAFMPSLSHNGKILYSLFEEGK